MSSKTWKSFHDLEMFFRYTASQKYFIAINIVHRTATSVCYLPLIASCTPQFSCAFANLRIATVSFVMSVCLPVCPHGTIRFPLGGFLWNFTFHCIYNEELNDLQSSPNTLRLIKSSRMRWVGHVARMGERRGVGRVLVGKLEGKRSLGRPRRRWENTIKMDLKEVGCGVIDWVGLAQERDRWRALVNVVMNTRVP